LQTSSWLAVVQLAQRWMLSLHRPSAEIPPSKKMDLTGQKPLDLLCSATKIAQALAKLSIAKASTLATASTAKHIYSILGG
jgi:hypothetical protein